MAISTLLTMEKDEEEESRMLTMRKWRSTSGCCVSRRARHQLQSKSALQAVCRPSQRGRLRNLSDAGHCSCYLRWRLRKTAKYWRLFQTPLRSYS